MSYSDSPCQPQESHTAPAENQTQKFASNTGVIQDQTQHQPAEEPKKNPTAAAPKVDIGNIFFAALKPILPILLVFAGLSFLGKMFLRSTKSASRRSQRQGPTLLQWLEEFLSASKSQSNQERFPLQLSRTCPVTEYEQKMYWRLCEDFPHPDHVVMPQVAFSALITSWRQQDRNQFNRKRADFVICDRSFAVLAVVELDDSSHAFSGRAADDEKRDAMLEAAGYTVLRYPTIPEIGQIKDDLRSKMRISF